MYLMATHVDSYTWSMNRFIIDVISLCCFWDACDMSTIYILKPRYIILLHSI